MTATVTRHGCPIESIDVRTYRVRDLKGELFDVPVYVMLGAARASVPVYGSGGFTSYSIDQLREQLGLWVSSGITMVKMKVGLDPYADVERVQEARRARAGPLIRRPRRRQGDDRRCRRF
ncbi:MAG TPA: hypothetical protein VIK27_08945 [Candidatus Aquilonibacter sp.]